MGIPWELAKDIPFCSTPPFTGFIWNLDKRTVDLSTEKRVKYLHAITEWESKHTHTLREVQKIYGKLLHTAHIIPVGRAYLTNLEAMLAMFNDRPFLPQTPPRNTPDDIDWWKNSLNNAYISKPIPGPCTVLDFHTYSDASSGHGIGIVINSFWRAWELISGWKRDSRDIGWAEGVSFKFLICTIVGSQTTEVHFKVYGDNRVIVEGWWAGQSRNRASNEVFKCVHRVLTSAKCSVLTCYVPSRDNPADGPSRGVYPPTKFLLPPIDIPIELQPFIRDIPKAAINSRPNKLPMTHESFHSLGRSVTKSESH